jgi:Beta-propeller repeat
MPKNDFINYPIKKNNEMKQYSRLSLRQRITAFWAIIGLCCCLHTEGVAQVAINTDGSNPSTNMILDLNPAVGKAFAPPSMTWAQIKAITPVKAGMFVYDTEFNCLRMYNGTKWASITEQTDIGGPPGSFTTQTAAGTMNVHAVATDASGNVYITGAFSGTATFGALPPIVSLANGGDDIFIVKYTSTGTALWVQKAGSLGFDNATSLAVDVSGNVYVTGYFSGTATFGGVLAPIVSAGYDDVFIVKYNTNGTALWVKKAGGISTDRGTSIAIDASGNVYITGFFYETATFSASSAIISGGLSDIFVAKYNNSGVLQWVQKAGGLDSDVGTSVAVDVLGSVYVTGTFSSSAFFSGLGSIISAGKGDIFVLRLASSDGSFTWVKRGGGSTFDISNSITVDGLGNCYLTGTYEGTADFGIYSINSTGAGDIFIIKYNMSGVEQWANTAGGLDNDNATSITIDATSNIYITGHFRGTTTFGNPPFGKLPPITSSGSFDIFVAKYNSSGIPQWVQKAGGIYAEFSFGIASDVFGNVYTTGYFTPNAQFGNQILTSGNMFLMKYSE